MMSQFREALQTGQVILMDGAMGTELRRADLPPDACGELWNLTNPERVRAIHQAYRDAGARCLLTNTFQSNPRALSRHGVADKLEEINRAAVAIARSVAGPDGFVLGNIGPIDPPYQAEPIRQVVSSLCGVDGLHLETYSDTDALWAVKYGCLPSLESEDVPVLLSITYKKTTEGVITTQGGQSPEVFAKLAREYGVSALGVNCGRDVGVSDISAIIRAYRAATDLPLFARPNAGTPTRVAETWNYPHSPDAMASELTEVLEAGATMIGGCCGTTAEHIAAFRPVIESWNERPAPGAHI
jgi:5-methyltetrahydrofolate--homocysteine methyltransferase